MKILLTGQPKSGKTTLLKAVIGKTEQKQGFVTEEVLKDDKRTGFKLVSTQGTEASLADIDSDSDIRVSKYGVNIDALDQFIEGLAGIEPHVLIYLDEIGQMELYSKKFKTLVDEYLDLPNPYLGTISSVYKDEYTAKVLNRSDVIRVEITESNREIVRAALEGFISNVSAIESLDSAAGDKVIEMAKEYIAEGKYLQLKKLLSNAVLYVANGQVLSTGAGQFTVTGRHGVHQVCLAEAKYRCDCKLYNGKDEYEHMRGECSHIQSVRLLRRH